MPITRIEIKNFRSILKAEIDVRNVSIFVGQNDEGKSNVLRALDLFFNGDKVGGYALQWADDFAANADVGKGRAKEITVELTLKLPPSFSDPGSVVWRKVWRREGLHDEKMRFADGSEFGPRSKIAAFLRSMRFDYVPAIKGADYFESLMGKLHDMLESTVEEEIRSASKNFTGTINANTSRLLADISSQIGLDASIELPTDLREVFSRLEFRSGSGDKTFSLRQRGDGIKVRHIAIILRWLANQANHLSAPGKPKSVTVWGYEEPENNLELQRCFEIANTFVDISDEIQSFVTTHSPAIYSVAREDLTGAVALFHVRKMDGNSEIQRIANETFPAIDGSMGLLSLLEPHMRAANQERERLEAQIASLPDLSRLTVFVEGPSDKEILTKALKVLYPEASQDVVVRCCGANGGGHDWVADALVAWSHQRPSAKAVGVFDADSGAKKSRADLVVRLKGAAANTNATGLELKPSQHLIDCARSGFAVPFAIEELFPPSIWAYAEDQGWLVDRSNLTLLYKFVQTDVTFDDYLSERLPNADLRRYVRRGVSSESKEKFSKHVAKKATPDEWEFLRPTVKTILDKLGLAP